jgi:hypothetical protein
MELRLVGKADGEDMIVVGSGFPKGFHSVFDDVSSR